jgi:hypothetical protein
MSLLRYSFAESARWFGCLPSGLPELLFGFLLGGNLFVFYFGLLFLMDYSE